MAPFLRLLPVLAGVLLLRAAPPLAAQQLPAHIEGVVFDSLTARPLAGAVVTALQVSPAPQQYFTATTDAAGHYRLDSLVAGRFLVGFSTPFMDSLEVQLPQQALALTAGQPSRLDFATPSRATLARGACPGIALPKGRGAIIGQVMNAESDAPLRGATIAVRWTDIGLDVKAMRPTSVERTAAITTDSLGQFRVCGVPTETYVVLQIQQQGKAGTPVRASVADAAAVTVQNLSLSPSSAREFAVNDTMPDAAAGPAERLLTGTASVSGIVRGADDQPLADAQIHVVDAAGSARSDATGHFSLGNLPAGTQLMETRHVGYLVAQQSVELRAGRAVAASVRLPRIVTLDSVRIFAQRERIKEFERRPGASSGAHAIVTASKLADMHLRDTGDLFRHMLGFNVSGEGIDATVRSTRGVTNFSGPCSVNIVIDGAQHQAINVVPPQNIGAIEIYRGAAGAPLEYDSSCGVIVIWTKR